MSQRLPLLIELGCEELPVKALPGLAGAFRDGILRGLEARGIGFRAGEGAAPLLYTARRLALLLDEVAERQPEQHSEVLGPYLNIGLDAEGQPTRALQGFAQKAGVDWQALERTTDNKGERFVHRAVKPGASTRELLPEILRETIAALPIPKPMRWGDHDYAFIRPVQWLVLLFGDDVVDCELLGVRAGRESRGHRFHAPEAIRLATPGEYVERLAAAKVLVDGDARRARIRAMVAEAARTAGGTARIDDGVLEEVNCLVEWPVPVACSFEQDFLRVPQEALILTMETNQKFFPVLDGEGRLSDRFIGIANIESSDPSEIRKGYERVIRPRFADAKFFFDEDLKQGLSAMNEGLASVTYQARLGTLADKVARVAALAETIAAQVGVDPALARRAALLSRADLQSRMVNEFPELQGLAGRYYAAQDPALAELAPDDRDALAAALDEVYMPRNAGDDIAPSKLGQVLAIAERLDTLAGGFAAGLKPTGNKDPFALRRNALGLARTLIEGSFDLTLAPLLSGASDPFESRATVDDLVEFVFDRLEAYLPAAFGCHDVAVIRAVIDMQPSSHDIVDRVKSLTHFAGSEDGKALAAANKRCGNLLRKAREEGIAVPDAIDEALFEGDAERALAEAIAAAEVDSAPLFAQRRYVDALGRLAQLRPAVDAFFDGVMVMADDPRVRGNRLALLARLQAQFLRIADIGRLATG